MADNNSPLETWVDLCPGVRYSENAPSIMREMLGCLMAGLAKGADMQETNGKDFDWNGEEGKQATARVNRLLELMDKCAAEGSKRVAVPLGIDADGEVFGVIVWRKP